MTDFVFTGPNGQKITISGPEGATLDDAAAKFGQLKQTQPELFGAKEQPRTLSSIPGEALGNLPSSAARFGRDIVQPFIHPIETGAAIKNLGQGVLEKMGITSGTEHTKYADAMGKFLVDRYGSMEAVKRTMATDPVGFLADASTLLTGGGAAAARLPGALGTVGEVARTAGRVADPLSAVTGAAKVAGKAIPEVLGGGLTHTGGESIRTAAKAGYEGGPAAQAFKENLRGQASMDEAVADARQAVQQIRRQRSAEYRAGMGPVRADQTVLNFNDVDNALANISAVKTFKGQSLSPSTQQIRQDMAQAIQAWKMLPPQDFHTAEGLDALKQKIGDMRDATQYGTPERKVADDVYHSIRQTIVSQVPEYAKVMRGYEEASNQIKEIERTLSLNPNASIDTALRKLQSTLRDNVNTNFGQRKQLAQYLINSGAPHLMEKLAGQALNSWLPRGFGKAILTHGLTAAGGAALGGAPGAAAAGLGVLPAMSPRIAGEAAFAGGQAARQLGKVPRPPSQAAFQAGRTSDALAPSDDALAR